MQDTKPNSNSTTNTFTQTQMTSLITIINTEGVGYLSTWIDRHVIGSNNNIGNNILELLTDPHNIVRLNLHKKRVYLNLLYLVYFTNDLYNNSKNVKIFNNTSSQPLHLSPPSTQSISSSSLLISDTAGINKFSIATAIDSELDPETSPGINITQLLTYKPHLIPITNTSLLISYQASIFDLLKMYIIHGYDYYTLYNFIYPSNTLSFNTNIPYIINENKYLINHSDTINYLNNTNNNKIMKNKKQIIFSNKSILPSHIYNSHLNTHLLYEIILNIDYNLMEIIKELNENQPFFAIICCTLYCEKKIKPMFNLDIFINTESVKNSILNNIMEYLYLNNKYIFFTRYKDWCLYDLMYFICKDLLFHLDSGVIGLQYFSFYELNNKYVSMALNSYIASSSNNICLMVLDTLVHNSINEKIDMHSYLSYAFGKRRELLLIDIINYLKYKMQRMFLCYLEKEEYEEGLGLLIKEGIYWGEKGYVTGSIERIIEHCDTFPTPTQSYPLFDKKLTDKIEGTVTLASSNKSDEMPNYTDLLANITATDNNVEGIVATANTGINLTQTHLQTLYTLTQTSPSINPPNIKTQYLTLVRTLENVSNLPNNLSTLTLPQTLYMRQTQRQLIKLYEYIDYHKNILPKDICIIHIKSKSQISDIFFQSDNYYAYIFINNILNLTYTIPESECIIKKIYKYEPRLFKKIISNTLKSYPIINTKTHIRSTTTNNINNNNKELNIKNLHWLSIFLGKTLSNNMISHNSLLYTKCLLFLKDCFVSRNIKIVELGKVVLDNYRSIESCKAWKLIVIEYNLFNNMENIDIYSNMGFITTINNNYTCETNNINSGDTIHSVNPTFISNIICSNNINYGIESDLKYENFFTPETLINYTATNNQNMINEINIQLFNTKISVNYILNFIDVANNNIIMKKTNVYKLKDELHCFHLNYESNLSLLSENNMHNNNIITLLLDPNFEIETHIISTYNINNSKYNNIEMKYFILKLLNLSLNEDFPLFNAIVTNNNFNIKIYATNIGKIFVYHQLPTIINNNNNIYAKKIISLLDYIILLIKKNRIVFVTYFIISILKSFSGINSNNLYYNKYNNKIFNLIAPFCNKYVKILFLIKKRVDSIMGKDIDELFSFIVKNKTYCDFRSSNTGNLSKVNPYSYSSVIRRNPCLVINNNRALWLSKHVKGVLVKNNLCNSVNGMDVLGSGLIGNRVMGVVVSEFDKYYNYSDNGGLDYTSNIKTTVQPPFSSSALGGSTVQTLSDNNLLGIDSSPTCSSPLADKASISPISANADIGNMVDLSASVAATDIKSTVGKHSINRKDSLSLNLSPTNAVDKMSSVAADKLSSVAAANATTTTNIEHTISKIIKNHLSTLNYNLKYHLPGSRLTQRILRISIDFTITNLYNDIKNKIIELTYPIFTTIIKKKYDYKDFYATKEPQNLKALKQKIYIETKIFSYPIFISIINLFLIHLITNVFKSRLHKNIKYIFKRCYLPYEKIIENDLFFTKNLKTFKYVFLSKISNEIKFDLENNFNYKFQGVFQYLNINYFEKIEFDFVFSVNKIKLLINNFNLLINIKEIEEKIDLLSCHFPLEGSFELENLILKLKENYAHNSVINNNIILKLKTLPDLDTNCINVTEELIGLILKKFNINLYSLILQILNISFKTRCLINDYLIYSEDDRKLNIYLVKEMIKDGIINYSEIDIFISRNLFSHSSDINNNNINSEDISNPATTTSNNNNINISSGQKKYLDFLLKLLEELPYYYFIQSIKQLEVIVEYYYSNNNSNNKLSNININALELILNESKKYGLEDVMTVEFENEYFKYKYGNNNIIITNSNSTINYNTSNNNNIIIQGLKASQISYLKQKDNISKYSKLKFLIHYNNNISNNNILLKQILNKLIFDLTNQNYRFIDYYMFYFVNSNKLDILLKVINLRKVPVFGLPIIKVLCALISEGNLVIISDTSNHYSKGDCNNNNISSNNINNNIHCKCNIFKSMVFTSNNISNNNNKLKLEYKHYNTINLNLISLLSSNISIETPHFNSALFNYFLLLKYHLPKYFNENCVQFNFFVREVFPELKNLFNSVISNNSNNVISNNTSNNNNIINSRINLHYLIGQITNINNYNEFLSNNDIITSNINNISNSNNNINDLKKDLCVSALVNNLVSDTISNNINNNISNNIKCFNLVVSLESDLLIKLLRRRLEGGNCNSIIKLVCKLKGII
ncbi:hypothetical protein CDIK_0938 [Cucumispora dikerogammari]|nr:hypothetical protein CDIK_0938 [Cucumispora dikerogammari]